MLKQVGSPIYKLFENLCKKADVQELSDKINSIEKSVEDIQRVLENNVDSLKSKLDISSIKLNELENITNKNKVELSDVSSKITSIRNVLDRITIQTQYCDKYHHGYPHDEYTHHHGDPRDDDNKG